MLCTTTRAGSHIIGSGGKNITNAEVTNLWGGGGSYWWFVIVMTANTCLLAPSVGPGAAPTVEGAGAVAGGRVGTADTSATVGRSATVNGEVCDTVIIGSCNIQHRGKNTAPPTAASTAKTQISITSAAELELHARGGLRAARQRVKWAV